MAHPTLKRLTTGIAPVLAVLALVLAALYLMSGAAHNSAEFGRWYSLLLVVNILSSVLLVGLIGVNLFRLVRQYRNQEMGSRLTLRLVATFVLMSVVPVLIVYYFSLGFLQRGIDSWFDLEIEQALSDALKLSRTALDERMRELHRLNGNMARELADTPEAVLPLRLGDLRAAHEAAELTLISPNGRIIASSSDDTASLIPNRPSETVLLQIQQGRSYLGLDPIPETGLHVRSVVPLPRTPGSSQPRALQALFPVAQRLGSLAENVQAAFTRYRELSFLRDPLKYSFVLTLSLVLLQSLLVAVWAAFHFARRLVAPVKSLAYGTRAVAAGDYDKQLPMHSDDEMGTLVQSFNDMTRRISLARDEAKRSQLEAEEQKAYLETVLGRLSSGVITLDMRHYLRTANRAASRILGGSLDQQVGHRLDTVAGQAPHLAQFVEALRPRLKTRVPEWREEVTLSREGRRQILMCRGTTLPSMEGIQAGYMVVFDDITALVQAQRDAAWGEMARRLAHEIKNPLTPIQLAAERLRHKYLDTMEKADAEVLERATHTIVHQVENMKELVRAFTEYARAPKLEMRPVDLNELVEEIAELYRGHHQGVEIRLSLAPQAPLIEADPGRIRQLLHNLMRNASEAVEGQDKPLIALTTRPLRAGGQELLELAVHDSGPGISDQVLERVFEPYVTTKAKGTGLGLAIVKKIVEEHNGDIVAENARAGGANILVHFPAAAAPRQGQRSKRADPAPINQ